MWGGKFPRQSDFCHIKCTDIEYIFWSIYGDNINLQKYFLYDISMTRMMWGQNPSFYHSGFSGLISWCNRCLSLNAVYVEKSTDPEARHYQKKKVVGLERGPLSLVSTTEELLDRKVAAPV
jgi:hypothetical protein